MPKIRILPENLSNKIAAGEVVERPCSVVKELVENALDAHAGRIIIEVENGGKSLIRVSDNGIGMNGDDAMLALERYATSKIYKDDDLFSIKTLGFRGEALPSIASVSRFSLVTKDEASKTAAEIIVEGGRIKKVSQTGAPQGTMVTVGRLFYNIPARRKFLKSASTEMGHIADIISSIALGNPNAGFRLYHNRKIVKNWLPASDPFDRVMDVTGTSLKSDFCKLQFNEKFISIAGWILSPKISRSTSRGIYIYVNNRFVRDRVIQHALLEGYRQRLMKGRFPVAVLFVDVPFEQVDVNVHPAKQEVRFARQKEVHEAVKDAVSKALRQFETHKWAEKDKWKPDETHNNFSVSEPAIAYTVTESSFPPEPQKRAHSPLQIQDQLWDKKTCFADLKIIGRFYNTYIICESNHELVLIDQHAAHERVLYEQLKSRYKGSKGPDQSLLIPETVDLGYREAEILKKMIPEFLRLGLEIEPFGNNTFAIKSAPAILAGREIRPLIIEMVEKIAKTGFGPDMEKGIDKCLITMACHGAIRANQALTDTEIKTLLNQLDQCENPSNCPHGRPTWIKWSKGEVEKMFGR
ncbi:MAG: DNA mismatch repair endonuclease MutL [Desulfobacterales bacterium]|nr:DNA mismatch repair endonuclease MutL [Desulfobacterales bacterium]